MLTASRLAFALAPVWISQVFAIQDLDATLNSAYDPYVQIWLDTVGPNVSTAFLTILFIAFTATSATGVVVTSRAFFSLCRDDALPFSSFWYSINHSLESPVRCIILTCALTILLGLFIPFSDVAFAALTGIATACFFLSTAIPTALRVTIARKTFIPGPWSLGRWAVPVGWISVIFVTFIFFVLVFPPEYPIKADWSNFNFAPLVIGGVLVFVNLWWLVAARKRFRGRLRNITEAEAGRLLQELAMKDVGDGDEG